MIAVKQKIRIIFVIQSKKTLYKVFYINSPILITQTRMTKKKYITDPVRRSISIIQRIAPTIHTHTKKKSITLRVSFQASS